MEYYWNDDHTEIAVLVSVGFGAGWSTWNEKELAYDKRVVDLFIEYGPYGNEDNLQTILQAYGYEHVYLGGWEDIVIRWVPINTYWRITEYDGAEGIEYFDPEDWNFIKKEN